MNSDSVRWAAVGRAIEYLAVSSGRVVEFRASPTVYETLDAEAQAMRKRFGGSPAPTSKLHLLGVPVREDPNVQFLDAVMDAGDRRI